MSELELIVSYKIIPHFFNFPHKMNVTSTHMNCYFKGYAISVAGQPHHRNCSIVGNQNGAANFLGQAWSCLVAGPLGFFWMKSSGEPGHGDFLSG